MVGWTKGGATYVLRGDNLHGPTLGTALFVINSHIDSK